MASFVIEHRAPGPLSDPSVGWDPVATLNASGPAEAIQEYCQAMQWTGVRPAHDVATVPGVGLFRAVPARGVPLAAFMIQRQRAPGADERHITWADFERVEAFDEASAVRACCERHQWESVTLGDANVFRPYGLGLFRVVPAHLADQMRITPAP